MLLQGENFSIEFSIKSIKNLSIGFSIKDRYAMEMTGESIFNKTRSSVDCLAEETLVARFSSKCVLRGGESYSIALRLNSVSLWDRSDNIVLYTDDFASIFEVVCNPDNIMWFKFYQDFNLEIKIMKIYLVATAGYPNFGDEIVLRGWLEFITTRVYNVEIWIDCHSPGMLNHLFYNEFPNVHFTNFVWDVILNYAENNTSESLKFGKLAWNEYNSVWERQSYMQLPLLDADIVHIIGTGFLNSIWAKHYGIISFIAYAPYKKTCIRKFLSGAGLMPLNTEILDDFTTVLNKFDKIDLRDKVSFETLLLSQNIQNKKLTMSGDDSFLLEIKPSERINSIIGLCIQGDFWDKEQVEILIEYVNQLRKDGEYLIRFYELIPGIDRKFYENLQSKLNIDEYRDFKTNFNEGLDVSSNDIFISSFISLKSWCYWFLVKST